MGGSSYKAKYHGDRFKSAFYASQEEFALAILSSMISNARLNLNVVSSGLGTMETGIVDGVSETRWDFTLVRVSDKKVLGYIEVTGDFEKDRMIRILSEKVEKALRTRPFVWFMYLKRTYVGTLRNQPRFVTAYIVKKNGRLVKWLDREKPYYELDMKHTLTSRQFIANLKRLTVYG